MTENFSHKKPFLYICMALALVLGLAARLPYYLVSDFPLNDGGMFSMMIDGIRRAWYALPFTITYNQLNIPFAYPPLGFYLGAVTADLLHVSTIDVLRWLPLVINLLCLPLFVLVAGKIVRSDAVLLLACIFFPLMPKTYDWLIMGGGVTRSLGFLFMLASMFFCFDAPTRRRSFIATAVFLALAVSTHLEWGLSACATVALLLLIRRWGWRSFFTLAGLGAAAFVLSSPWWLTVLLRYGAAPFINASQSSYWSLKDSLSWVIELRIFTGAGIYLAWLAMIGFMALLARGDALLPIWLVAVFFVRPRSAETASALPIALISAEGLWAAGQYLVSLLERMGQKWRWPLKLAEFFTRPRFHLPGLSLWLAAATCLGFVVLAAGHYDRDQATLSALTSGERQAMSWAAQNTPQDARFVVFSPALAYHSDAAAEWFPALAERVSLATVQGTEWLPDGGFMRMIAEYQVLKSVQVATPDQLPAYLGEQYPGCTHVAIFQPEAGVDYRSIFEGAGYRLVFEDESAVIFSIVS